MKKAQLLKANDLVVVDEDNIPSPPSDGLVIQTSYGGVCHSDLHQFEDIFHQGDEAPIRFSNNPAYNFPVTPGHEISGTVYSLGNSNQSESDLKIGDSVVVYPWIGCQNCKICQDSKHHLCPKSTLAIGIGTPGGYASYVVVPEKKFAFKIPTSIPLSVGCMFSCSALTAFSGVKAVLPSIEDAIKYKGQARILIVGAGGLGLWATQFASRTLPQKCSITVADINKEKLEAAQKRGSDESLLWDPQLSSSELVALSTKKGFYDAAIDFVNTTDTSKTAFNSLAVSGMLVLLGLFGGESKFSLPKIVLGSRKIQGFLTGSMQNLKELIELAQHKELISPPLEFIRLENVREALSEMKKGRVKGRFIIDFTGLNQTRDF